MRLDGTNSFERNCDSSHRSKRPSIRCNLFQFIYGDKSDVATVLDHDEATTSCTHQIVFSERTQIQVSINSRTILRHHVTDPNMSQSSRRLDSYVAGRSGVLKKPSDKGEPQSAETSS